MKESAAKQHTPPRVVNNVAVISPMINKNLKVSFIKAKKETPKSKSSVRESGSDARDPIDRDIDMVYRQP